MDKCQLCYKSGTSRNPINKHHIKGKKFPDVMKVHTHTCHWYSQWVTNIYLAAGREDELTESLIRYLYQRTVTMRHEKNFVLPIYD